MTNVQSITKKGHGKVHASGGDYLSLDGHTYHYVLCGKRLPYWIETEFPVDCKRCLDTVAKEGDTGS